MKRVWVIGIILCLWTVAANAQVTRFRSGIFLHHSTGGCIWGPNGSSTSVPEEMQSYNLAHGYVDDLAVAMAETWYPAYNDNEWSTWHSIFERDVPEAISGYYSADRIIMVKSCFPSSAMEGWGQPADTTNPWMKTVCNYKWHWRHMVQVMRAHPANFFVIWTNAPLERQSTNPTAAHLSDLFCTWAADTLAQGRDPLVGAFPHNVYVFDFFHQLAGPDGIMYDMYRAGPGDSHPNAAATELVAPQLVTETFDHSIAYESEYGGAGVDPGIGDGPTSGSPLRIEPNPSDGALTIRFAPGPGGPVEVRIYDPAGCLVRCLTATASAGDGPLEWDGRDASGRTTPAGVFYARVRTPSIAATGRLVRVR